MSRKLTCPTIYSATVAHVKTIDQGQADLIGWEIEAFDSMLSY